MAFFFFASDAGALDKWEAGPCVVAEGTGPAAVAGDYVTLTYKATKSVYDFENDTMVSLPLKDHGLPTGEIVVGSDDKPDFRIGASRGIPTTGLGNLSGLRLGETRRLKLEPYEMGLSSFDASSITLEVKVVSLARKADIPPLEPLAISFEADDVRATVSGAKGALTSLEVKWKGEWLKVITPPWDLRREEPDRSLRGPEDEDPLAPGRERDAQSLRTYSSKGARILSVKTTTDEDLGGFSIGRAFAYFMLPFSWIFGAEIALLLCGALLGAAGRLVTASDRIHRLKTEVDGFKETSPGWFWILSSILLWVLMGLGSSAINSSSGLTRALWTSLPFSGKYTPATGWLVVCVLFAGVFALFGRSRMATETRDWIAVGGRWSWLAVLAGLQSRLGFGFLFGTGAALGWTGLDVGLRLRTFKTAFVTSKADRVSSVVERIRRASSDASFAELADAAAEALADARSDDDKVVCVACLVLAGRAEEARSGVPEAPTVSAEDGLYVAIALAGVGKSTGHALSVYMWALGHPNIPPLLERGFRQAMERSFPPEVAEKQLGEVVTKATASRPDWGWAAVASLLSLASSSAKVQSSSALFSAVLDRPELFAQRAEAIVDAFVAARAVSSFIQQLIRPHSAERDEARALGFVAFLEAVAALGFPLDGLDAPFRRR